MELSCATPALRRASLIRNCRSEDATEAAAAAAAADFTLPPPPLPPL
jgi:hypothetical protein